MDFYLRLQFQHLFHKDLLLNIEQIINCLSYVRNTFIEKEIEIPINSNHLQYFNISYLIFRNLLPYQNDFQILNYQRRLNLIFLIIIITQDYK
ncbi:unnamed protein product [Paramecium pentaurelia]|uniref:Uncharacterized protein n=1 Tax=Paramecium pentaurelia TaxID=43138 RepID=A0A8S1V0G0_9CILI|nr:unnamed protein product [Paramecium pentaurelia]